MTSSRFEYQIVELEKGNKETFVITVVNNGVAVNLTGYTIKLMLRPEPGSYVILADSTIDAGMSISDAANGSVYASGLVGCIISSAVSQALPDICYGEIQAISGGNLSPITLAKIKVIAYDSIVR